MSDIDYSVLDRKIASVKRDITYAEKMPESDFKDSMMSELYDELSRLVSMKKEFRTSQYNETPPVTPLYPDNTSSEPENTDSGDDDESVENQNWRDVVLPSALGNKFIISILAAVAALILTIVLLIFYKTPQCCMGFALCGVLAYKALALRLDYANGKIKEMVVTCASVSHNKVMRTVRAVFRTDDDPPAYYDFTLSGNLKQHSDIQPNYVYVIYIKEDSPRDLLAYVQM